MDARDELLRWLADTGYALTHESRGGAYFAERREECRLKPGSEVAYPDTQIAALVVDTGALLSDVAQKRLQQLLDWKSRQPGRSVAILAHQSVSETDLLFVRGHDLVVRFPISSYPADVRA